MPSRRPLAALLGAALATPLLLLAPAASAAAPPTPAKPYDFNGDGHPDLAIGAPFLTDGKYAEGGVAVLTASGSGLSAKAQVLTPDSPGVVGESGAEDQFAHSFASGDFDGDSYADLAVGLPVAYRRYEAAGAVTVLYGSAKGLTGARSLELLEPGGPQFDTAFGYTLAAGDLDGDGRADLAVSAPYDYQRGGGDGAVAVFRSGPTGLSQARSSLLHGRTGPSENDPDGSFGAAIAVGDLDQDGLADLVVASLGGGSRSGSATPGSVSVCYGASGGPSSCPRLSSDVAYAGNLSLAVGNVSGTSRPEVVVGLPNADEKDEGTVQTLSLSGPRSDTKVTRAALTQDSPGVRGTAEKNDEFGWDVVLGDLDADGFADLVVGAPGEDKDKGRVTVVYGGATGYRTSGGLIFDQNTKGVPGKAEKEDRFGASVALLDHDGDSHPDLTVGAPDENGGDGAVTLLRGSGASFTTKGARTDTLKNLGYSASRHSGFGEALGA